MIGMGDKSSKIPKRVLKRITVYVSPELKSEMKEYKETNYYSSLSGMLKTGYRILIEKEIEEFPIDEIPNYEEVAVALLDFILEFDGIKDFVLMAHFRSKYSEGIIWATLNKLQKQRNLTIKKGEWFINS